MKKLMMMAMVAVAAMVATADDYGFTYQAELKDDKGAALESRNQTVEIRLWKTATGTSSGDLLWGRTYNIYTDENGLFNQEVSDSLGSRTSDDPNGKLSDVFCDNGAGTVYLGLKVKDSAGEIVPRQRLFAVPFAGRANSANNLVGDTHSVGGTLQLDKAGSSLSSSGLVLPSSSVSTIGTLTAESVTCKGGDLTVANVSFTGNLTGADSKEIIPVPVGGIIMWTKSSLPDDEHWAVCDGSEKNGITTPDLSGRFIVGTGKSSSGGTTYSYGNKGGEETVALNMDQTPQHKHTFWSDEQLCEYNEDGIKLNERVDPSATPLKKFNWTDSPEYNEGYQYYTGDAGGDTDGNTVAHENRPPYYALYYIMRIK